MTPRDGRCFSSVDLVSSVGVCERPTLDGDTVMTQGLHCPSCHGTDIVRHGMTSEGKQRSRCREGRLGRGRTCLLEYSPSSDYSSRSGTAPHPLAGLGYALRLEGRLVIDHDARRTWKIRPPPCSEGDAELVIASLSEQRAMRWSSSSLGLSVRYSSTTRSTAVQHLHPTHAPSTTSPSCPRLLRRPHLLCPDGGPGRHRLGHEGHRRVW